MAQLVAFLCSERAGYITGAVIPVDGGLSMWCRPSTKLIVHAGTRHEAVRKMQAALGEMVIEGIEHNRELQLENLNAPEFLVATYTTDTLNQLIQRLYKQQGRGEENAPFSRPKAGSSPQGEPKTVTPMFCPNPSLGFPSQGKLSPAGD